MAHIFISYSHKDTTYAHGFADYLQNMGFDVWIDERLDYGSTWPQEIQKQLDSCTAFIVIMTSRSFDSEWVQNELNRAKRLGKPIYPLLLEGVGPWLSVESTQFADVRDGSFPDEKFYSNLERVVPRTMERISPQPTGKPAAVKATDSAPRKVGVPVFAGIGVLVLIILGVVYFSGNQTSSETPLHKSQPVDSISTEVVLVEPTEEGFSTEIVVPTDVPLAPELIDANGVPMLLVPAGEYVMGSDNSDPDAGPAHLVSLDAYYIDAYEVTNGSYAQCVEAGECKPPLEVSSFTRTDYYGNPEFISYPVVNVDWYMARSYCAWRGASLPTEAQWEVAARGENGFIYPWGNSFDCRNGNFDDEIRADEFVVSGGPNCDGYEDTAPVGGYLSGRSPFGLFDMAGNVWEWVSDSYLENYYATLGDDAVNPQGPSGGQYQVVRGGSWGSNADVTQTIYRGKFNPADAYDYLGLRCAVNATSAKSTETIVPSDAPPQNEFVDAKGVEMVFVPAGSFIVGSDTGYDDEKPVHTVYLDDFYIDKYEVTNALYKTCVDLGICQPPDRSGSFTRESYYGNSQFDNYPVVFVSWDNANAYCAWRGMELPTEAQWEKAARGTDGWTYPWGNTLDGNRANYADVIGDTTEVGSYENGRSPYGAYDMAGNVWEWVADWYSNSYYLNTTLTNPAGPITGDYHVLRGGSWHDDERIIRTTNRGWSQVEYFYNVDFGFRCAMDGTP